MGVDYDDLPDLPLVMRRSPDPVALWRDFAAALGPEAMAQAFRPPAGRLYPTERRWEAVLGPVRVGWGALVTSPYGDLAEIRLGTFPPHGHRGVRKLIHAWLFTEAFRDPAIRAVEAVIRATNPFGAAILADCAAGRGPWFFNGMLHEPPPARYYFALTRARWENA
jgi:hypothetical protein